MTKIRYLLVPVLLLATAALSSSNVLPILTINNQEPASFSVDSQQNDNIFSDRFHPRNFLNDVLYTISIAKSPNLRAQKLQKAQFVDNDNKEIGDDSNVSNKNIKFYGDGFRQEQWHNYPRQLDRLHKYLYEHHNPDKRNPDPDDPNNTKDYFEDNIENPDNEKINEIKINNNDNIRNGYDADLDISNRFLIFKIRLACLGNDLKNHNLDKYDTKTSEPEYVPGTKDVDKLMENIMNPQISVSKVKREEVNPQNAQITESSVTKNRAVKKRIFSLWSRLQSFNHKGHELQHRRHLHAFYGLPSDGDTSGVLTAETRATFMRPPGSPLRWG